jgi:hypothetical protein
MKNRYFILSVLFWAVASVCMAITLPSSSYSGFNVDNDNSFNTTFTVQSRSITGSYLSAAAYTGECGSVDPSQLGTCCNNEVQNIYGISSEACYIQCKFQGGPCDCLDYYDTCMSSQTSLPLGTPLLLLPFALVYAFVRRKRNVVE